MLSFFEKRRTAILYGIIGVSAVVVDLSFFLIFFNLFSISAVISTILSVSISTVYAFTLNAKFNFKTKDLIKTRFLSYVAVSIFGMLTSVIFIKIFSFLGIDPNITKIISLPPIVLSQYFLNKNLTFKKNTSLKKFNMNNILPNATIQKSGKKIAIIGGGFTGLTAAYTLAKMGHSVTVIEAEKTLGGLVSGFEVDGLALEKAYHFLYKTDKHIINLANEIGVGDKLHFHASSVSLAYGGTLYPFMTPMDLLRFKPLSFLNRLRAGIIALYLSKETRWQSFAEVSAIEWMRRWGGEEVTKVIWEPVLRGKFFDYYDKIAMSYLWSRVYVRANSKDKGDVTEKLGYFEGGFGIFINRLEERCRELGVEFKCETKPDSLIQRENSAEVVVAGKSLLFDACLTTTPSHVFKKLIDNDVNIVSQAYLDKLSSINYLGAVLMVFTTDTKFTDYYWHNVNDPDQPFLVLLSLSALVGTEQLQGKHVYYVGAYVPHDHKYYTMSDEDIKTLWVDGIKRIFPTFDAATITSTTIFRMRNAQHIVEPGYAKKIVPYQSELENLYLANYTQIFPDDRGTNYAVEEGIKVAELINENLKM